jgi:YD repeat-containing protein
MPVDGGLLWRDNPHRAGGGTGTRRQEARQAPPTAASVKMNGGHREGDTAPTASVDRRPRSTHPLTAPTTAAELSSTGQVTGYTCGPGGASSSTYETTDSYDALGDLEATVTPYGTPATETTTDTYYADGTLDTSVSPDGVTTTNSYTPSGWLSGQSYSDSETAVSYGYDVAGDRTSMSDASGSTTTVFDPSNQVASTTNGDGQTTSYGYDTLGDVTAVSYPLGSAGWVTNDTVEEGRNALGQLTSVSDFAGNTIGVTVDADGLPTAESLPTTTATTISTCYGANDGVTSISLEPTADASSACTSSTDWTQGFAYSDTTAGLVSSETDTPSGCSSESYTYDADGRLSTWAPGSCSGPEESFDASGNLLDLPGEVTASYQAGSELCWSDSGASEAGCSSPPTGATTYTYNGDGDLTATSSPSTSATWDGKDQLTAFDDSSADMTSATYDGNGLRTASTVGTTTQHFSWDSVSASVPRLLTDGTNAYIYADGSTPLEQVSLSNGTATYLLSDLVGSVRGVVAAAGTGGAAYGVVCG